MSLSSTLTICSNFSRKNQCVTNLMGFLSKHNARYFRSTQSCAWRVLFFGNDIFSLASLKILRNQLENKEIKRLEVVTKACRGNPVMEYSLSNEIPCHKWPHKSCDITDFDLGAVVSFGYLIPNNVIKRFPLGMINVHASLLPRWRGASPISYALLHGDTKTGVSLIKIEPYRFDVGDIISQVEVPLKPDDTFTSVVRKLSIVGALELGKCIKNLPQSLECVKPQGTTGITYAPKITKEMADINFETMDASAIVARERAITHLFPLTTCWCGVPAKLYGTFVSAYSPSSKTPLPGHVYFSRKTKSVHVECFNRTFVSFSKIVLRGHGPMSGLDFNNGFLCKRPEHERKFKQLERLKIVDK